MASVKKNKNPTPLLRTNLWWQETSPLSPKSYLHSKCPKNSICVYLRLWKSSGIEQCIRFNFVWFLQIAFLGSLEWRYLFSPKGKVSYHQKLDLRTVAWFLFVLTGANNDKSQPSAKNLLNFLLWNSVGCKVFFFFGSTVNFYKL